MSNYIAERLQQLTKRTHNTIRSNRLRRRRAFVEYTAAAQQLEQRIVLHQPHDPMLAVAISPDFQNDGEVLVLDDARAILRSVDGGRTFHHVADPIIVKSITTLVYSPAYSSDNAVFAGTEAEGIYRSTDGGLTWTQAAVGMQDFLVRTIAFSPDFASDQTVYVGTQAGSIYRSVNGGDTWQRISASQLGPIVDIEVSPNFAVDRTLIVAQFGNGTHRSINAGNSFSPINTGLTSNQVQSLALPQNFATTGRIVAGTTGGVFISNNRGASWSNLNAGLTDLNIIDVDFTPDGRAISVGRTDGIYVRNIANTAWTEVDNGVVEYDQAGGESYFDLALSRTFATDSVAFVATFGGVYRTRQPAPLWVEATVLEYRDTREVAVSPNFATDQTIVTASQGGGLMKSTNAGEDWTVHNHGMGNVYLDNVVLSPNYAADQTMFSGNFIGVFKSTDGGQNWSLSELRPDLSEEVYAREVDVSPNFAVDQFVAAGASGEVLAGLNGFYRSTDGGSTWTYSISGLPANPRVEQIEFSPNFAVDRTIFTDVQGSGVYKSTDAGLTWSPANVGIETTYVRRMQVSPTYAVDQTLFAVASGQLARSTNGGASWTVLNTSFVPGVTALSISPDYATDQTVWLGAGPFGVYRSTDGGQTWNQGSTGLEGVYINDVTSSPDYANDSTLFVGTTHGTFRSTDGGDAFTFIQRLNRYEDERDVMVFNGGWSIDRIPGVSGPFRHSATNAGARVEFEFYGSQISWIGSKGPDHGRARVTLDGNVVGVIDLYDPVAQVSTLIGTANVENGWHTVVIEVLGTRRPASTNTRVSIDAFDVIETV